jgi:predicted transcriptional regulator
MKSRLRQSPLAQPEVAFARQEPVTENASKEWEAKIDGFNKRPIVCYQDVFNVLRVIENVDGYMKKTTSSYVAVLAR